MVEHNEPSGELDPIAGSPALLEIIKAGAFLESLRETYQEITDTSLDLSAEEPYSINTAHEIIDALGEELIEGTVYVDASMQELQEHLITITSSYRLVALNTLIGIGEHFHLAKRIAEEMGPDRNAKLVELEDVMQAIVNKETYLMVDLGAIGRTFVTNLLTEITTNTHYYWTYLFNQKGDSMLAKEYLLETINENALRDKFGQLKNPTLFSDNGL